MLTMCAKMQRGHHIKHVTFTQAEQKMEITHHFS